MIGTVTRVQGRNVHLRLSDYPGKEVRARAVVHRVSTAPEAFTTYAADDVVHVVDDDEGGFLVVGVVAQ